MSATPSIKVKMQSLQPYRSLFPRARVLDQTVSMGATVADTVGFIPHIISKCSWQVNRYVNQELKGLSVYDACQKLWNFVKYHIDYKADQRGVEQVRSPRRLIHDGQGDCDCMTTFVDCCLRELKIKKVINRITKYKEDHWQHIYSIIPIGGGKYITMDCVAPFFNYEVPYSEKEDYPMELQFLDGIDDTPNPAPKGANAQKIYSTDEDAIGELGKLLKRASKKNNTSSKPAKQKKPHKEHKLKKVLKKVGKKIAKGVHVADRVNPAAVLLRAGILASMKLNLLKVASSLKWGYATKEYAASKGMDMTKFDKLRGVLNKVEKIFYEAGGKPENLKKSILTGHGNKNHEVAGLHGIDENTPLALMLGAIYHDEFIDGINGLGELGEPATATAVASASTLIGTIAALLKSIGNLFPHKNKVEVPADQPNQEVTTDDAEPGGLLPTRSPSYQDPEEEQKGATDIDPAGDDDSDEDAAADTSDNLPAPTTEENEPEQPDDSNLPVESSEDVAPAEDEVNGLLPAPLSGIRDFYDQHKGMILGATVVAAVASFALYLISRSKTQTRQTVNNQQPVNGFGKKSRKKQRGGKRKNKPGEQSIIKLM